MTWTMEAPYETEDADGNPLGTGPDLGGLSDSSAEAIYGIETRYTHSTGFVVDITHIAYEGLAMNLPDTPKAWWIDTTTHSGLPDGFSGDWSDEKYEHESSAVYWWSREDVVREARKMGFRDVSEYLFIPKGVGA